MNAKSVQGDWGRDGTVQSPSAVAALWRDKKPKVQSRTEGEVRGWGTRSSKAGGEFTKVTIIPEFTINFCHRGTETQREESKGGGGNAAWGHAAYRRVYESSLNLDNLN